MRRFFLLAALLLPAPCLAQSAGCHPDKITNIDSSGRFIEMTSGQAFRIYPGKGPVVLSWAPLDDVQVCPIGGASFEITDTDQNGAKVKALSQSLQ